MEVGRDNHSKFHLVSSNVWGLQFWYLCRCLLTTIFEGKRTQRPNLTQPSLENQGVELNMNQFYLLSREIFTICWKWCLSWNKGFLCWDPEERRLEQPSSRRRRCSTSRISLSWVIIRSVQSKSLTKDKKIWKLDCFFLQKYFFGKVFTLHIPIIVFTKDAS